MDLENFQEEFNPLISIILKKFVKKEKIIKTINSIIIPLILWGVFFTILTNISIIYLRTFTDLTIHEIKVPKYTVPILVYLKALSTFIDKSN